MSESTVTAKGQTTVPQTVRNAMRWDAKVVKPLPDYRIFVEVVDGRKGVFDLKPYLEQGVWSASFLGPSLGRMNKTLRQRLYGLNCSRWMIGLQRKWPQAKSYQNNFHPPSAGRRGRASCINSAAERG